MIKRGPVTSGSAKETTPHQEEVLPIDMRKIMRGMLRYLWLILLLAIVGAGVGRTISKKYASYSTASAVLIYQSDALAVEDNAYNILHLSLPSAVEMIPLPVHLKAVQSILGLRMSIEDLQDLITVDIPSKDSNLITITVEAENPALAKDIANTLAQVVVRSSQNLNKEQWQKAYTYFASQLEHLRRQLDNEIGDLAEFRQEHRFLGMDIDSSATLQDLIVAEKQLNEVELEYTRQSSEYENLKEEYEKIPSKIKQPLITESTLTNQIAQVESALLLARTKFAPNNPKIKSLESQLIELRKAKEKEASGQHEESSLLVPNPVREKLDLQLIEMEAKVESTEELKEELVAKVDDLKQKVSNLSEHQLTFAQMLAKKQSLENKIFQTEQNQRNAEIKINLGKGDLELYQQADRAFSESDQLGLQLLPLIGVLLGAIVGVSTVLGIEIADPKLRTAKQVEMLCKTKCLLTIPRIRNRNEANIQKKTLYPIRRLADRIQHINPNAKSLVLTSSNDGEGKSFLLTYMAKYYRRLGKNVLYLSFDGSHPKVPLENYLRGSANMQDLIIEGDIPRLETSGEGDLQEMIEFKAMDDLWTKLNSQYDFILIDAPGVLEENFAGKMMKFADIKLFLIDSSNTNKNLIENSMQELEGAGISLDGIILNNILPAYLDTVRVKEEPSEP